MTTPADRIIEAASRKVEEHRRALDAAPDLSSVQLIVQLDRYGPGRDKVILRTECGHLTRERTSA